MGLDMYLNKYRKVTGLTANHYDAAASRFHSNVVPMIRSGNVTHVGKPVPTDQLTYTDFESLGFPAGSNDLNIIQTTGDWPRLGEEVGYWRKANMIHSWFVKNVQNGEDDCEAYFVTIENLVELLGLTRRALDAYKAGKFDECGNILPPTGGFFFGPTDIGEWYVENLETTIEIIEKALVGMDWDKEVLIYGSSW